jgi:hypothetical protein
MPSPRLNRTIKQVLKEMESFEASGSVPHTGTGARREGDQFERLVGRLWAAVFNAGRTAGAQCDIVNGVGERRYARLSMGPRSLFIPATPSRSATVDDEDQQRWLEVTFEVSELIASYPTEAEAIRKYAPDSGPYSGSRFPGIYDGLRTRFDDTVVLVEDGVLREKILLEYKTAKSSGGRQIDGNAHERLSFQIMQYLEVATRYTKCSLAVLANGAFVRYRNKYHVNFHVQADRMRNFAWFTMDYACAVAEYERFVTGLLGWLFEGKPRSKGTAL